MERELTYCFETIAAFRQFVKDCQRNIETAFPNFPKSLLRDLEDINIDAATIDVLLGEIDKAKENVGEYSKHLEDIINNLKDTKLLLMEKEKGLRCNPGRSKGAGDSGVYSVDSCVLDQMSIEEENNNRLIVQPDDKAEQAESAMPEITEAPSEVSLSKPSEHTDKCESDFKAYRVGGYVDA